MAYFFRSTTAINASIETIKTRPTPRGLPSDLMYFLRIQKAFSRNPQKTIIYQRAKYDEPQSQKYDFRNLLTDTAMMRASIMQRHRYDYAEKELAPDGTLVDVPFTVGLIADRSYEFVGVVYFSLFRLLSFYTIHIVLFHALYRCLVISYPLNTLLTNIWNIYSQPLWPPHLWDATCDHGKHCPPWRDEPHDAHF